MDALMAAFVAALLAQASDRTPWLTAMLSTRFARPGVVIAGTLVAIVAGNVIATIAGAIIGPRMAPNAQTLLLAIALLFAGGSALFPIKPPNRLEGWRTGPFLTSLAGVAILSLGDRTQFITGALAARSTTPALAAVGATLGAMLVNVPAILGGEALRKALPLTAIRITAGILFLIVGAVLGFSALRLI